MCLFVPIAQWIECWPPEPKTGVRVAVGTPNEGLSKPPKKNLSDTPKIGFWDIFIFKTSEQHRSYLEKLLFAQYNGLCVLLRFINTSVFKGIH